MKIGLFTDGLAHLGFEDACAAAAALGIQAVEIGTGNFSPSPHCNLDELIDNPAAPVTQARTEVFAGAKAASAEEAVARD